MVRPRRRRRGKRSFLSSLALVVLAIPLLYLAAALVGALIPVNRDWREPDSGVTVYLADNGVHADLVLPATAQGLDWRPLLPARDVVDTGDAQYVAFGAGERAVYLDTPTWADLKLGTALHALAGASAWSTCNVWVADRMRIAGVKAPLWSPFVQGLVGRYKKAEVATN